MASTIDKTFTIVVGHEAGREDARIEAVLASTEKAYVGLAKVGPFWR